MKTVILASDNQHKIQEFRRFFSEYLPEFRLISMRESGFQGEIEETAETFEGNSYIKASTVAKATGMLCIADDSGLAVDALNGAPGVHSARYCGHHGDDEANIVKLLNELKDVPDEHRTARFVCVITVARPDGSSAFVRGEVEGRITHEKHGNSTFGYDPVFLYEPYGKTFGEISGDLKDAVSHRGNALRKMVEIQSFFEKESN